MKALGRFKWLAAVTLAVTLSAAGAAVFGQNADAVWVPVANSHLDGYGIKNIVYGNNIFVAVGNKRDYSTGVIDSKIAYSTDGISWAVAKNNLFGASNISAIAYGKDRFVAVGNKGKMAYSSDGVTWTAVKNSTFDSTDIYAIAYGNNRFVAGGGYHEFSDGDPDTGGSGTSSRGKFAYSSDGINWTSVKNDKIFELSYFSDIVWGNGKFVAIAETHGYSGGHAGVDRKLAYSSDGITWTAVNNSPLFGRQNVVLSFGNNMFIATSPPIVDDAEGDNEPSISAYSSDGITWTTAKTSPFSPDKENNYTEPRAIVWGNDRFVVVGAKRYSGGERISSQILYSPNGKMWTEAKNHAFGDVITSVAWGNGRFVAGSANGKIAFSLTAINSLNDNANYTIENGVIFNKDKTVLILYPKNKQGAYAIPNSVTAIGESAFSGCTGLTSITIGNNAKSIGWQAFSGCTGLASVTIPNSVTAIGDYAFSGCTGLTSITIPNSVTSIGENAFYMTGLKPEMIPNRTQNGDGSGGGGGNLKKRVDLKVSSPDFMKGGALTGGRSRDDIQRVVMQNMAALRYAYNRRLRDKPGLNGKINVKFAIDEYGKVIFAQVVESTMDDSELERTVVDRVKSWNFGKIDKPGDVTEVVYPFVFSQ